MMADQPLLKIQSKYLIIILVFTYYQFQSVMFVSLFNQLKLDYQYLTNLAEIPYPHTRQKSTLIYKDKQTQRTFLSQIHNDNISSYRPSRIHNQNQFQILTEDSSSSLGTHLALIQINLNNETIQYNVFSDTTSTDVVQFVQCNFEEQYRDEMISIIVSEISKATKKLRQSFLNPRGTSSSSKIRDRSSGKDKENLCSVNIVKGKKNLKLFFNQKNMGLNLSKLCITNKLSDKERNCILRGIKRGDVEINL